MHIYIGNLPEEFTEDELKGLFAEFGAVSAATIGMDKKTEKSQGYGFVEMHSKSEGRAAVEALRGKEIKGKALRVKALKPDDEFLRHAQNLHGVGKAGAERANREQVIGDSGTPSWAAVAPALSVKNSSPPRLAANQSSPSGASGCWESQARLCSIPALKSALARMCSWPPAQRL